MTMDKILLIDLHTHPNPKVVTRSPEELALRSVLTKLGEQRQDQNWVRKQMRSYSRGVLTVARALRIAGFTVHYVNPAYCSLSEILDLAEGVNLVGISAATPFADHAFDLASTLKTADGTRLIVLGGPHATALPEDTLKQAPAIDVIVLGDGEKAMVDLAKGVPYDNIINTAYRLHDGIRVREPVGLPSEEFCAPDYGVLPGSLGEYRINLQTVRGCSFRCAFCAGQDFGVREIPESVIEDEMRQLHQLCGNPQIHICDTDFARYPDRAERMCKLFRKYLPSATTFSCDIRADSRVPSKFFWKLQELGMRRVCVGFESSCESALVVSNKGTTFTQCLATAAQIRSQSSMLIYAYWIIGLPGMTRIQVEDDIECAASLIESGVLDEVATSVNLIPLPGSDMFSNPLRYGMAVTFSSWDSFFKPTKRSVYTTEHCSSEDIRELYQKYLLRMRYAYESRLLHSSRKT